MYANLAILRCKIGRLMSSIVAEKIQDFFDTGIPEVIERDLDLGAVRPPARGKLLWTRRMRSRLRAESFTLFPRGSGC